MKYAIVCPDGHVIGRGEGFVFETMVRFPWPAPQAFVFSVGYVDDGPWFEYDSNTGKCLTSDGQTIKPGDWVRLRIKKDDSGRFEKEIEIVPPPGPPIGPMFRCPFHDYEQFESGPCPDCYDERDS